MANISYCVSVYNFTDEVFGSGGYYNDCVINTKPWTEQCLLRDTIFTFPPADDGGFGDLECDEYGFVVTAVTPLGRVSPSPCIRASFSCPGKTNATLRTM